MESIDLIKRLINSGANNSLLWSALTNKTCEHKTRVLRQVVVANEVNGLSKEYWECTECHTLTEY